MNEITIKGKSVQATTPEGATLKLPVSEFVERVRQDGAADCGGIVFPPGVRAFVRAGQVLMLVYEIAFGLHRVRWRTGGAPFGDGCEYGEFTISLPYILIMAPFIRDHEGGLYLARRMVECHVANKPLQSLDDKVCAPPLLNCSKYTNPLHAAQKSVSWLCTATLNEVRLYSIPKNQERIAATFADLVQILLHSGFNLSSNVNEGSSWYTESAKQIPEISDLGAWEKRSREDPTWVLRQQWLDLGYTARGIIDRRLKLMPEATPAPAPADGEELVQLMQPTPPRPTRRRLGTLHAELT